MKKSLQSEYGQKVRSLVFELIREPGLIRDGGTGCSLVENPVSSLASVWQLVLQDNAEQGNDDVADRRFRNNSELLHKAVFTYIKQATGRKCAEHLGQEQYNQAYHCGLEYIRTLRKEMSASRL